MKGQDETRTRIPPANNLKRVLGTGSHNALTSALTGQRSDLSQGKYHWPRNRGKSAFAGQHVANTQVNNGATMINFRQTKRDQNIQMTQKVNKDTFNLRAGKTSSVLQPYDAVQNIGRSRNMLLNKNKKVIPEIASERSLSKKKGSVDVKAKKGVTVVVRVKGR